MVYKTILLSLITFALYGQIMLSPNRAEIIDPPVAGGSSTGFILPQSVETTQEDPWLDDDFVDAVNIYGAGEASITSNTYDSGDQSYVCLLYTS